MNFYTKLTLLLLLLIVDVVTSQNDTTTEATTEKATTTTKTTTKTTTTTTTTTKTTTTTTEATPKEFNYTMYKIGPHCTCDLTIDECDIDCCCDSECSLQDMKVFKSCIHQDPSTNLDPRYCFKTEFIIGNNSQFAIKVDERTDLFCVIDHNIDDFGLFIDRPPTHNLTDFKNLLSRHRSFQWKFKNDSRFNLERYTYGSPVRTFDNKKLGIFTLDGEIPVRYMEDHSYTSDKIITLDVIPEYILKSPLGNETKKVILLECEKHDNHLDCLEITDKSRIELIHKLSFVIHHSWVDGIDRIEAMVEFKTTNLKSKTILEYEHVWHNPNITNIFISASTTQEEIKRQSGLFSGKAGFSRYNLGR